MTGHHAVNPSQTPNHNSLPQTLTMSHEETPPAPSQRKNLWHVAVLVNSEYHGQGKDLPGVLDDAETLESCEFYQAAQSKRRWDNLTFEDTRQHLQAWSEDWKDGDLIMFFFFGHGAYSAEKRTQCLEAVDGWLIDLMNFRDFVQNLKRINFCAFFACCQDHSSDPGHVRQLFPLTSPGHSVFGCQTLFHFACRPGQDMYDAPAAQSMYVTEYTACLVKILRKGRYLSEIPIYLQEKVSDKTLMQQHPEYMTSFVGDCAIWGDGTPISSLGTFSASGSVQSDRPGVQFLSCDAVAPDRDAQSLEDGSWFVPVSQHLIPEGAQGPALGFRFFLHESCVLLGWPRVLCFGWHKARLECSLNSTEQQHSAEHPDTLGKAGEALGAYHRAKEQLQRNLKIKEQQNGWEVARTLSNLGYCRRADCRDNKTHKTRPESTEELLNETVQSAEAKLFVLMAENTRKLEIQEQEFQEIWKRMREQERMERALRIQEKAMKLEIQEQEIQEIRKQIIREQKRMERLRECHALMIMFQMLAWRTR